MRFAVDSAKTLKFKPKRCRASPSVLRRCGRVAQLQGEA
jgi:hypothetical protein